MTLTDTHAHLYSEQFNTDRDAMMQRALSAGVSRFFVPAIDSTYAESMFRLEQAYPENVFLMMGLHPTHVKENYLEELDFVRDWIDKKTFYGIGEIGIDLYWDKTYLKQQQIAFRTQLDWAKEKNLPVVIHSRDSFDEIFAVLEDIKDEKLFGIFHCFTGNLDQAWQAITMGMKLGIGGVITFKNGKIDQFLHEIPLKHLVLETDSPYLAPVPYRGKRNESSYLLNVLQKLSAIYDMPESVIAAITTQNSKDVFGI
jgi:TatD DNase family protein